MAVNSVTGKQTARIIGRHEVEIWRKGKLIHKETVKNGITNGGANYILNAGFFDATDGVDTWFIGLITNPGTLAAADTLASHAGWTEWTTVDESPVRQAWVVVEATGTARALTNTASVATFTMSAGGTLKGIFVCSVQTGTSGLLWSTANFTSAITVLDDDVIKVTYSVSIP